MIDNIVLIIGSEIFGIFILFIMVVGRNLILKADSRFFPKKESELTDDDKKQLKKMKFLGRALLWACSPFVIFWGYNLSVSLTNL